MNIEKQIIDEFLSYSSTSEIAQRHGIHKDDVKLVLRNCIGKSEYLRISRIIGGRIIARKLKSPGYKLQYVLKMHFPDSNLFS